MSWNMPPATRSPFGNAARHRTGRLGCARVDQLDPFHRWIRTTQPGDHGSSVEDQLSATARSPFGSWVTALTLPCVPCPSGDQPVPSQRAMLFATMEPACVKVPATIRSPFCRTVSAQTVPLTPPPRGDHVVPSHTYTPCGSSNGANGLLKPPATSWPLGSAATAKIVLGKPLPSADHVWFTRSNAATPLAGTVPARLKNPPTTSWGFDRPPTFGTHHVADHPSPSMPGTPWPGTHLVVH